MNATSTTQAITHTIRMALVATSATFAINTTAVKSAKAGQSNRRNFTSLRVPPLSRYPTLLGTLPNDGARRVSPLTSNALSL
jgi:hypothetical protein